MVKKVSEPTRLLAEAWYKVILIGSFVSYTNHDVPRRIEKKGMLLLRPILTENRDGDGDFYERVEAVIHRVDTHGDFTWTGWMLRDLKIV
jgi:hypothetical protein